MFRNRASAVYETFVRCPWAGYSRTRAGMVTDDDPVASRRRRTRRSLIVGGGVIMVIAVVVALLSGPSPPRTIELATGQAGGVYDRFGAQYATRLERIGLRTEIRRTAGSLENLNALLRGEVDVA